MLCDSAGQSNQLLCGMCESQQTTNNFNGGCKIAIWKRFCNQTKSNQRRTQSNRERQRIYKMLGRSGSRDLLVWDPLQVEKRSYSNWGCYAMYNQTTVSTNLRSTLIASQATKMGTWFMLGFCRLLGRDKFFLFFYHTNLSHKIWQTEAIKCSDNAFKSVNSEDHW